MSHVLPFHGAWSGSGATDGFANMQVDLIAESCAFSKRSLKRSAITKGNDEHVSANKH